MLALSSSKKVAIHSCSHWCIHVGVSQQWKTILLGDSFRHNFSFAPHSCVNFTPIFLDKTSCVHLCFRCVYTTAKNKKYQQSCNHFDCKKVLKSVMCTDTSCHMGAAILFLALIGSAGILNSGAKELKWVISTQYEASNTPIYQMYVLYVRFFNEFHSNPLQVSVNGGDDCHESFVPFPCAHCTVSKTGVLQVCQHNSKLFV